MGLTILALWSAGFAVLCMVLRARRWFGGAPADAPSFTDILMLPRRYFVDVHRAVERRPAAARMHILLAGGLVATFLLALLALIGWVHGRLGAGLLALAGTAALTGTGLAAARRLPTRPAGLSDGAFFYLPVALGGSVIFFMLVGIQASLAIKNVLISFEGLLLLALGTVSLTVVAYWMAWGPMRHAVAGALHLVWHPRPKRFRGATDTALKSMDFDASKLGVERLKDFRQNQIVGFDACVQCGRCEEACPAFAAGLPLNPKKLIFDLANAGLATNYSGSPYPGFSGQRAPGSGALISEAGGITPETLWSCTTCRACVSACPMMIEHVDAIVDLRRFQTLELAATPGKAPLLLTELCDFDSQGGRELASRFDWGIDLNLKIAQRGQPFDVLLWVGEAGFDLRNQRSLRAFVKLLRVAGVDFAVLGANERDCGDVARRLGDEITFARLACDCIAELSPLSFDRIVTMDPHIAHCVGREYAAFGASYKVEHHTTFLAELLQTGRLKPVGSALESVTYHDPCYLSRYLEETDSPRDLLDGLRIPRFEMKRHGRNSFCCGGGGGAPATDIQGQRRIPDLRMEQAMETGATTLAVACPNCTVMLEGTANPRLEVREISELLLDALQEGP